MKKEDAILIDDFAIAIGEYTISDFTGNTVWIEHNSGEGGEFRKVSFAKAIAEFVNKNY